MRKNKKISIYSGMTNEELNNLHEQFTFKYGAELNEGKIIKKPSAKQGKEIYYIGEFIKEYLYRKFRELALIIYLVMQKCNDFGVMGEERVSVSFCRNIQGIPNDRHVTQLDANHFMKNLNECDGRNGYKTGEEYLAYIKNYELELLGKKYSCACLFELNAIFDLLGLNLRLFCTNSPYGIRFIFGAVEEFHSDENKVYIVNKEYIRSPQFVLSVAAEVIYDCSMIRRESCEVIFFNKWHMFYQLQFERQYALCNVNSDICEGIKEKALYLYGAYKTEDVLRIKETFIQNMINGIKWHEAGHRISLTDMDALHAAFWHNLPEGEEVGTVLIEALADWAPVKGKIKGAMAYFTELATADIKQANREYYVYMSDNWFVNESEFMALMSNVLVGLAISFINAIGFVDFERLNKEIGVIYSIFQERYKILLTKIFDVIYQSEYELCGNKLNYKELETETYYMYQNSKNAMPVDELRKTPAYWINIFGYLKKYSQTGWAMYQKVIKKEGETLEKIILQKVSNDNMEKYNSLREYIIKRAIETGIISNNAA
ncbi:hypothetical protein [Treponema sp. R80B11-R83G3]